MTQPFAGAVQETARQALQQAIPDESFRTLVARSLEARPYVLSGAGGLRAAPLVLGAFQAAGGGGEAGVRTAAAMELLLTSLHLFDGLADGDAESTTADIQVGLALQFTMSYILSGTRVQSTGATPDWSPIYRMLAVVCTGQQRDIDMQRVSVPSLEDAKVMTLQKTGAFGEALTAAGALAAGAPPPLLKDLALVGQYLGMHGQVADDATDASPAKPSTSDIQLRKKTLPIVFFLNRTGDDPERDKLRQRFLDTAPLTAEQELAIRRAIEEAGGLDMAYSLASWYRMKAISILETLRSTGCNTHYLDAHLGLKDREAAASDGPARG